MHCSLSLQPTPGHLAGFYRFLLRASEVANRLIRLERICICYADTFAADRPLASSKLPQTLAWFYRLFIRFTDNHPRSTLHGSAHAARNTCADGYPLGC